MQTFHEPMVSNGKLSISLFTIRFFMQSYFMVWQIVRGLANVLLLFFTFIFFYNKRRFFIRYHRITVALKYCTEITVVVN